MTEERIITAAVVISGEKGDGLEFPKLLEIGQENEVDAETIIGDAAYFGKENLKTASEQNSKVVARLNPSITQGFKKNEGKFEYNKDADRFVCPAGHLAIQKHVKEQQILEKTKHIPIILISKNASLAL